MGDTPVSNADPYATTETGPDDWVTHLGPHLMMLVQNQGLLDRISTDHLNGGPWVMWPDTPYAHIMIPLESRGGSGLASELRAQVDFLPVTACEVHPEAREPVTHVHGP